MNASEGLKLLVDRLASIRSQMDQLQEAAAGLEAAIAARVSEGPVKDSTGKTIAVVKPPGLRFNTKRAMEELKDEMLPEYQDFSATRLKAHDPDLYETFRDPSGNPKVEIIDD